MKRIFFLILLLLPELPAMSQYDRIDSLLLDVFGNDKTFNRLFDIPSAGNYLFSGINYNSKTFFAGREIGDNMFSMDGNLYLFHSSGFYAGVSGSWYSESGQANNFTIITGGIRKPLNRKKTLNIRTSYSRYIFSSPDSVSENVSRNCLGAGLSLSNSRVGGSLSFNAFPGKDFSMSLSPAVFSNITIINFRKTGKIMLSPEVSLFIGSEIILIPDSGNLSDPSATNYTIARKYGLLNTMATLPVNVYAGNFSFGLGYSVNFPLTQDKTISYPVNSFFAISVAYLVSFY